MGRTIELKSIKGVTLIELLIAISLLTLIIFAGSGIYLSGWSMFRDAQIRSQAQRNAMIPMAHIVKNIQQSQGGCVVTNNTQLDFTQSDGTTGRYMYSGSQINYFSNIDSGPSIIIGTHISDCSFTTQNSGAIADIIIEATDNSEGNPYQLQTRAEARYASI